MLAVLIVDIWKTTPFMALLFLAGAADDPEATSTRPPRSTASIPWQVFWKVTLPLIRPALMVAVIFRGLDAFRIFDLIYVLTPNNVQTKSMSVFARENLVRVRQVRLRLRRFDPALRRSSARFTILFIWLGRVNLDGGR